MIPAYPPVGRVPEAERKLREAAQAGDADFAIGETALALSLAARPALDLSPYRAHLSEIATSVAAEAQGKPDTIAGRVMALNNALVERLGYRGDRDTYDDLRNADLAHVIDRRRGLPVSLAVLWIDAARAQGWAAWGLSFPSHFLVRVDGPDGRAIVDPFNFGQALDTKALRGLLKRLQGPDAELQAYHYAAVPDRTVLLRCVVDDGELEVAITDHAGGFDPASLTRHPEVTDPERLEHERGLGIPIILMLADELTFSPSDGGTQVVMRFGPRLPGGTLRNGR